MRRRVSERASPLTNEPEDNVIITRLSGGAERRDPGIFQHTHAGIPFSALSPLSLGDDRKTEEPPPLRRTSPSSSLKQPPATYFENGNRREPRRRVIPMTLSLPPSSLPLPFRPILLSVFR